MRTISKTVWAAVAAAGVSAGIAAGDPAGPNDYVWDFEDAPAHNYQYVTSLTNNQSLYRDSNGVFTNTAARFGQFGLQGRVDSGLNSGTLTNGYSQLTLTFWFEDREPNNVVDPLDRVSQSSFNAPGALGVQVGYGGSYVSFGFVGASATGYSANAPFGLTTNVYTQVALTFDHGLVRWFENGVLQGSTDVSGGTNSDAMYIPSAAPGEQWALNLFSTGDNHMDDVGIYSRALSTNDIYTIYQHGITYFNSIPEPGIASLFLCGFGALCWLRRR